MRCLHCSGGKMGVLLVSVPEHRISPYISIFLHVHFLAFWNSPFTSQENKKRIQWLSFQRFKRFWIRSESFIAFIDLLELWIREIFKRLFLFKWWNKKKFIENRSLWRQEQEIDFCNVCRVLKKGWGYQSYKWFKCYPLHFRQYHQSR